MDLDDAEQLCRALMTTHLGPSWSFGWDRAVRRFGQCRLDERRITLSRRLVALNEEPLVRDTVLHEIAHALAPRGEGHGARWKRIARDLGARGERCFDRARVRMPEPEVHGHCPSCGREVESVRRRTVACAHCCSRFNGGRFSTRFQILWHPVNDLEPEPELGASVSTSNEAGAR